MKVEIFEIFDDDIAGAVAVWNEVVSDGVAFPQLECLDIESGRVFFAGQSFVGVAKVVESGDSSQNSNAEIGEIVGVYILHPNNVGRCGHICNASYAVSTQLRGCGIGKLLVTNCLKKAKEVGFSILQFNAVVATNTPALKLYEKLGFTQLGVIPKGFKLDDGTFADIIPHYIEL